MWTLRDLFMALSPEYKMKMQKMYQQQQQFREQQADKYRMPGLHDGSNVLDWMRYERPGLFNALDETENPNPRTLEETFRPPPWPQKKYGFM